MITADDWDRHDAPVHSVSNPETQKFKRGSKIQGILSQEKHLPMESTQYMESCTAKAHENCALLAPLLRQQDRRDATRCLAIYLLSTAPNAMWCFMSPSCSIYYPFGILPPLS